MRGTDAAALERLRQLIMELDAKLHEAEKNPGDGKLGDELTVGVLALAVLNVPPRLKSEIAEPLITAVATAQSLARRIDNTYTHAQPSPAVIEEVRLWIGRLRGSLALVSRQLDPELGKAGN